MITLGEMDWIEVRALDDGQTALICRRCPASQSVLCTIDAGDSLSELVGVAETHNQGECESRRAALLAYANEQASIK